VGVSILKSLSVGTETTFSIVPGSSYSSYDRVPAEQIAWTPAQEPIVVETAQTRLANKARSIVGAKGGTVSFRVPLVGLATPAAASTEAVAPAWLSKLIRGCAHSVGLSTGTTASTGWTTTSGAVASASGLTIGSLVLINGEVRQITNIVTSTLTVAPALTSAPGNGDVVYGGAYFFAQDAAPGTVSIACEGDGYEYTFTGCKGTLQVVDGNAGQRPMLAFEFQVDAFTRTKPSGDLPALPTATNLQARSSPFWWGATKRGVTAVNFNPGLTLAAQATTEGAQGRSGWVATDGDPQITATAYRDANADDAAQTDYEARTERVALWQVGTAPGAAFALVVNAGQISAYPAEGDLNGQVSLPLTISARATVPVYGLVFF
jgi:hypothetical protein